MSSPSPSPDQSKHRMTAARFDGGRNIALKTPPHQYEATVRFYRDVLGLKPADGATGDSVAFEFGANTLWIDEVPSMSQAELWLEIVTDDTAAAEKAFADAGVTRCDEIEEFASGIRRVLDIQPCYDCASGRRPAQFLAAPRSGEDICTEAGKSAATRDRFAL